MFVHFVREIVFTDTDESQKCPLVRNKSSYCLNYPYVYFFGGRRKYVCLRDFWRFNLESKKWQEIFIENAPLFENHATCVYNDKLYVYGGQFGVVQSTLMSWRETSKRFKLVKYIGRAPPNYRGHTLVTHGYCLYVFGGWCEQFGASNTIWKFDTRLKNWTAITQSGECPSPRYSHSCVVFGDNMWIFGGIDCLLISYPDLWRYSFMSDCWTKIRSRQSPPPLHGHSACISKHSMLICGGYLSDSSSNLDMWLFSFQNSSWINIGTVEQHVGCNMNIYGSLLLTLNRSTSHDVSDLYENECKLFVRSINGNQAQKSGDSGYSDYTSQDSLVTKPERNSTANPAVNGAFINDEYNVPGYVAEKVKHKKYASTLAIPQSELTKNDVESGIELKQFISPFSKSSANISTPPNLTTTATKILLIGGDSFNSKPNYLLCTLDQE